MRPNPTGSVATHSFHAVAFVENLPLRDVASHYPESRRTPHYLQYRSEEEAAVFLYPFGAIVFLDAPAAVREHELARLRRIRPELTSPTVIIEQFTVRVDPMAPPDVVDGVLWLDRLTAERASIIAMTVGQSAAMEYYERIVDDMFVRTDRLVDRLERRGSVSWSIRPLHRVIGAAIGTRNEVLTILHLLDKPDEAWEDPGIGRIYEELRAEFDLGDRYQALELKLRSIQEALELVLNVARDRRLVLLEASIVLLIVVEIVLTLLLR